LGFCSFNIQEWAKGKGDRLARPQTERLVRAKNFASKLWKPVGVPVRQLEEVVLTLDQVEALYLADGEGLYQEAAARKMGVSRQTFGRIVAEARHRVADALLNGKALKIEGGEVLFTEDEPMHQKIALPTKNGEVDPHMGHCQYFTLVELKNGAIAGTERVDAPDGCGCKSDIISRLAQKGVTLIIAGNMGEGVARLINSHGIELIRGAQGAIEAVVLAYIAGELTDSGMGCGGGADHDCAH